MKLRFLGTGAAGGMPLYGCDCHACIRARTLAEFRREPACACIASDTGQLLIDAGLPELGRRFPPETLQAILLTHFHMDHVQGLFQIRWGRDCRIPVIGPDDPNGADDLLKHPGILDFGYKSQAFETISLAGMQITPLPLNHSRPTLGYAFEAGEARLAYLTDTVGLPARTNAWLRDWQPRVLVLDCSHPPGNQPPRNHNDLNTALQTIAEIGAKRTLLTHIGHAFDQWLLQGGKSHLPEGVEVARDQMTVELEQHSDASLQMA